MTAKSLLAALAFVALAATACEEPAGSPSSLASRTTAPAVVETTAAPVAEPTEEPTTEPAVAATTAPPTRKATPRPAATTAAPKPTPVRTTSKPKVASTCGAPANPWGYNFCGRGAFVGSPPASFCDYFDCIASFWESTNGYVMQCDDLTFSHSGGRSGSCSHHDGNYRPLYG